MPQIRNFTEAQDLLRPYYNNARTVYTLDVMRALMDHLGNPQDSLQVLHVAGTSGKTSTAYYCAALLKASGKTVGLSVSPHVDTVNERLQVNGSPLPEAEFCQVLGEFIDIVTESGIKPSYFELLAAMAYWEFARRGLDFAVIEVGLGGLLDGTNVVSSANKICLITDIGLDHTEILGETLPEIALQKVGIVQPGNSVFMHRQAPEIMNTVESYVGSRRAHLQVLSSNAPQVPAELPLFQQRNLSLALAAVEHALGEAVAMEACAAAAQTTVPARLERFEVGGKIVIVDGSHNQQKMHTLLESITQLYPDTDMAVLCAFVQGGSDRWKGAVKELAPAVKHAIVTGFQSEQDVPKSSVNPGEVAGYYAQAAGRPAEVVASPADAYRALLARPESLLLVTGSFYLLNHVRPLIKEQA